MQDLEAILPDKILRDFQIELLTEHIDEQLMVLQRERVIAVQAALMAELDARNHVSFISGTLVTVEVTNFADGW